MNVWIEVALLSLSRSIFPPRTILWRGDIVYDSSKEAAEDRDRLWPNERWPRRGVVVRTPLDRHGWIGDPRISANDYEIEQTPGCSTVTNNLNGHWKQVPYRSWTHRERVIHHCMTYREDEQWHEPGEPISEYDRWEYQLLLAMVPPEHQDEIMEFDTPDICELAIQVIEYHSRTNDEKIADLERKLALAHEGKFEEVLSMDIELKQPPPRTVAP